MSFSPLGQPIQGAQDEGETIAEFPVLVAGKTAAGVKKVPEVNPDGSIDVTVVAGGGGAVTVADGADVNAGSTTDAAITTDSSGTLSGKLRGLVKMFSDVWDDARNLFRTAFPNRTVTATLDTTDQTVEIDCEGGEGIGIRIDGGSTFSASVFYEATDDGTFWYAAPCLLRKTVTGSIRAGTYLYTDDTWIGSDRTRNLYRAVAGARKFRVRIAGAPTNTAGLTMIVTRGGGEVPTGGKTKLPFGTFSVSTFRTLGSAASPQTLFAYWNSDTSPYVLAIKEVTLCATYTAALTAVDSQVMLGRGNGVPSGGTFITPVEWDTTENSGSLSNPRGATAADGGAATTITPAGGISRIWQGFIGRLHTAVGHVQSNVEIRLLPSQAGLEDLVILRPNECLYVQIINPTAGNNPATNHYIVNCKWEVMYPI